MINVIRTRKAIIDALPRALLKYIGQNLGPALVTVIVQSIQAFLSELAALPVPAVLPVPLPGCVPLALEPDVTPAEPAPPSGVPPAPPAEVVPI